MGNGTILVAAMVGLWLAASGRLGGMLRALFGDVPNVKKFSVDLKGLGEGAAFQPNQEPKGNAQVVSNVGWVDMDRRKYYPDHSATFGDVFGHPK